MKETFGLDSRSPIPSSEGNGLHGRFDDMEHLHSLTTNSLNLGLWLCFLYTQVRLFAALGLSLYTVYYTVTFTFIMLLLISWN